MKMFIRWIKEGEEHGRTFERCSVMQIGRNYLTGTRNTVRKKIRFVRLIRELIGEKIIVNGMREIYEEGCRILSEMVGRRGGREEEESEEEEEEEDKEEEQYLYELCVLKVIGEEKKVKEDEMEVVRKKLEEVEREKEAEKRKREEAEKRAEEAERRREEERKRADEEKRKREEAEEKMRRLSERVENLNKELEEKKKKEKECEESGRRRKEEEEEKKKKCVTITRADGIRMGFGEGNEGIKREGNRIIREAQSDGTRRHCFIGEEMKSVCEIIS